jgi:hypothetical protein
VRRGSRALAAVLAVLALSELAAGAPAPRACGQDVACLVARYEALARADGVAAAFARLRADYERDDAVRWECHRIAHAIGHARGGGGDHFCGSGFDAGRVERAVAASGRGDAACAPLRMRERGSNDHHNCAHAIGHGMVAFAGGDVLAGLARCDRVRSGWERERCYGGAFMENVSGTAGGRQRLSPARPFGLCAEVAPRQRPACFRQQPSYAIYATGGDFTAVFRQCAGVRGRAARRACHEGLGVDLGGRSIAEHVTPTGAAAATAVRCELGRDRAARRDCAVGAVKQFVDHHRDVAAAGELCSAVEAALRRRCLGAARAYRDRLEPRRSTLCRLS